jgi:hypothetical protein
MINQPSPQLTVSHLPKLDLECFDKVCEDLILNQNTFSKSCLDLVVQLMLDEKVYGSRMIPRLCDLAIKLCVENNIEIIELKEKK